MTFSLTAYLDRIALNDVPTGIAALRTVQRAHMSSIPFENIDPLLGNVPDLAMGALMDKLITNRRGGYCFEQNALFGAALSALGFAPRTMLARVRNGSAQGGARTHQCFRVSAEGEEWLCDAGFGGHGAIEPLHLTYGTSQDTPNGTYRLIRDEQAGETVVERRSPDGWTSLYGFDTHPVRDIDLVTANFICARWEGAPFPANLMLAFFGPNGRIGVFNRVVTRAGAVAPEILASRDALDALLKEVTLDLPAGIVTRIWDKIKDAPSQR